MVPELVMQSAESSGQGVYLALPNLTSDNSNYYVALYFAEIDPLAQNETRMFDIVVNQGPSEDYYPNTTVPGGMYVATELVGTNVTLNSSSGNFQLSLDPDTELGPILNALEIFLLTPPAPNLTNVSDGK
jgi:hypothetical protein